MPDDKKTIEPIGAAFDEVAKAMLRLTRTKPEGITSSANKISILAPKSGSKEITPAQGSFTMDADSALKAPTIPGNRRPGIPIN